MNCPYCMYAFTEVETSGTETFPCPKCRKSMRVRRSRYARSFGWIAAAGGLAALFLGELEGIGKVKIVGGLVAILAGLMEMFVRHRATLAAEAERAEPGEFRNL